MAEDVLAVVHVIDDDASVRTSLARLLRSLGYAVQTHASASAFLLGYQATDHGCILLDLQMPGQGGLELQELLHRQRCRMPIVFMSAYGDIPSTVRAMKSGASDFLVKPLDTHKLLAAIETALSVPADDAGATWDEQGSGVALTARERMVLRGILNGRINKQLADELNVSERTIKSSRAAVMRKLGAQSLAELVLRAGRWLQN